MDSESVLLPSTQSNCKVKPNTSSNRSKLSLRRKKGKGYDNVTSAPSSSSPNKTRQTVNHLSAPGTKQEIHCETSTIEERTHLLQNVTGSETFDKSKCIKGTRFSLVLDKVVVPFCSVPVSTDEQSMVQVQTGNKIYSQDSTTQSGHIHLNDTSTLPSTNALTDTEASSSKHVELEDLSRSKKPEFDNTCHICKKDLSPLSLYLRQEHIRKCNEPLEEHVSTGAICLICKKQLKSEEVHNIVYVLEVFSTVITLVKMIA